MKKRFLLITANENETEAILSEECFKFTSNVRSDNLDDDSFYNVGYFGEYEAVHLELQSQGSVKSGASLPSIISAIEYWQPDAVILIGIAFGKDNEDKGEPRQHIGDVLISTMIVDYESGKIKDGKMCSDGSKPESGKTLISVFKNYSKNWSFDIHGRNAKCEFGEILSGDKVVDDPEFKEKLFNLFPRAIGGEMEGRGAYVACREKRMSEWIVVKAICDWGENKSNPNKQRDQIIAAKSAVSLLRYVLSNPEAFDKLPSNDKKKHFDSVLSEKNASNEALPLGYFISIGTTTCRLFEVKDKSTLRQSLLVSYDITDPEEDGYFDGIIKHVSEDILPVITKNPSRLFPKVFLDYNFADVFEQLQDVSIKDDFIANFYSRTNLCLNLLTKVQTIDNLKRLFGNIFGNITKHSAIININAINTDVLEFTGSEFIMHSLSVTIKDVKEYVEHKNYPEIWNDGIIGDLKNFILKKIETDLNNISVEQSIIIKNELKFMQNEGYPLKQKEGNLSLSQRAYKSANRELLFNVDYKEILKKRYNDKSSINRFHAFKYGHIIIETILDKINNKVVVPKDVHSIHGSGIDAYISYIFNVVISGSTHEGRDQYMSEARDRIEKMGATVLSPRIKSDGSLEEITTETQYKHLKAIKECDMLFICNKSDDGYIGESTKCEIYYAYALNKTIAFWHEPPNDSQISFIPNERWGEVMSYEI